MLILKGVSALSEFRLQRLLSRLQELNPGITSLEAEYVHFVDTEGELQEPEISELEKLTNYGTAFNGRRDGSYYVVVPRPGTISPWSTKASDIAHNSGLDSVKRIERGIAYYISGVETDNEKVAELLHDRMNEVVLSALDEVSILFFTHEPRQLKEINIQSNPKESLQNANSNLGLALSEDEIDYLVDSFKTLKRNPTDVELMMFAQVNSEHCRHKIFNADWVIDGNKQPKSLFKMIKNTYEKNSDEVLSAYSDNAAVISGPTAGRFYADDAGTYEYHEEPIHSVIKVETHNHPTAISPIPGASTGIGGEIRDEAATGRGAVSKMGLSGYSVSNLNIPGAKRPWEKTIGKPDRIVSALDIMLEAPIGGASFANEFGRPNLAGYFRTFEQRINNTEWGYHKPIMIAGGLGNIKDEHVVKKRLPVGSLIIHLGGPGMLIGLGGGAASSMQSGESNENLDFASVQRGNGEMERRAQEVITRCWSKGENNPIITIHDVGAGGLSNALPELVHDSDRGAKIDIRNIPSDEPGMSPLEIWCNESQERFVLGISPDDLAEFTNICEREKCPFAVVGTVTENEHLLVTDSLFSTNPIDLPLELLFGKPPSMTRNVKTVKEENSNIDFNGISVEEAVERVLKFPAVGSKKFLITIGDRTVGGLVNRDQMVGPWQVPVSDVAVTSVAFDKTYGEAMAMGERTPLATINPVAAARMAISEAITNIAAADISSLKDVKISANWMAAAGFKNEDQHLFESVKAVGESFCPELGITIPVGKDSLSMRTLWEEDENQKVVVSPVSLIVTGFSPVKSTLKTLTPELDVVQDTKLVLIDLSDNNSRLGGSALAQVFNQSGSKTPDTEAEIVKKFIEKITQLKRADKILAYHDKSDGGLLTSLVEMAFASRCGIEIDIGALNGNDLEKLFNEELGVVVQVLTKDLDDLTDIFGSSASVVGSPAKHQDVIIRNGSEVIYKNSREQLEKWWSDTSYQIQKLRDNPDSADQELELITSDTKGLNAKVPFEISKQTFETKPKVAILREQGVNGHVEMAAAFNRAGFTSVDVHLNDLINGTKSLEDFSGMVVCGGFSYGDVLGAGEGWAKSILFNKDLRTKFKTFFTRNDTFSLGVCNGCQMLSALKELIPGAETWPEFMRNESEQFEARLVLTKINDSPSIFFKNMAGAQLPVPVAHGEGKAVFESNEAMEKAISSNLISAQFVDSNSEVTTSYPYNPNGSQKGITSLTTSDGRATIIMPHPERAFLSRQLSWHPVDWGEDSPWMQMFINARNWVG
ncbi:MAG: phosphoribosylformylglycinamidine synthase [Candidatus Saccharimonadales bacterium]